MCRASPALWAALPLVVALLLAAAASTLWHPSQSPPPTHGAAVRVTVAFLTEAGDPRDDVAVRRLLNEKLDQYRSSCARDADWLAALSAKPHLRPLERTGGGFAAESALLRSACADNAAALARIVGRPFRRILPLPAGDDGPHPAPLGDTGGNGGGGHDDGGQKDGEGASTNSTSFSYDDAFQLMYHLSREWTPALSGHAEAEYGRIVDALVAHAPVSAAVGNVPHDTQGRTRRDRVLLPGCATGRLAFEVAATGLFDVEASDISDVLLGGCAYVAHSLAAQPTWRASAAVHVAPTATVSLDNLEESVRATEDRQGGDGVSGDGADAHVTDGGSWPPLLLRPFAHIRSNSATMAGRYRAVSLDPRGTIALPRLVRARSLAADGGDPGWHGSRDAALVFRKGAFPASHHGDPDGSFAAVVTCFFVDAVPDGSMLVDAIARLLRDGGVWVNYGPLHFHSDDAPPLALDQYLALIEATGFDVVRDEVASGAPYIYDDNSLRREIFRSALWVAVKRRNY